MELIAYAQQAAYITDSTHFFLENYNVIPIIMLIYENIVNAKSHLELAGSKLLKTWLNAENSLCWKWPIWTRSPFAYSRFLAFLPMFFQTHEVFEQNKRVWRYGLLLGAFWWLTFRLWLYFTSTEPNQTKPNHLSAWIMRTRIKHDHLYHDADESNAYKIHGQS